MTAPRRAAQFALDVPPEMLEAMTGGDTIAPRVSRAEALQVPAVLRARNLICGSLGGLPIRVKGPDRQTITTVPYLMPNPDPDIAQSVVMAQTYEDLLFEGVSWWRVTKFGWHNYPVEARHVPWQSVHVVPTKALRPSEMLLSPDQTFPIDGDVYIDGYKADDVEVIRFDSLNPPLLTHAARAIRTCLLLDKATALYAKEPLPLGYFEPLEGADGLSTDKGSAGDGTDRSEVEAMLDEWEAARRGRAWGYVQGMKGVPLQWDPRKLQLAEQRQHAVLEIARATGLDPEDLGVSTTTRTYQNGEVRNQALKDTTLGSYVYAVQDRLSMRDVLPRGYMSRIDFAGFLRADTKTRMETYKVGLEVGAYTDEEVREAEEKPALTPAQRARTRPPPAAAAVPQEPAPAMTAADPTITAPPEAVDMSSSVDFGTDDMWIHFDASETAESFQVDTERRTIVGLAVPWGKVARSGFSKWRFAPDSLRWSDTSRVKLNLNHDRGQLIGVATRLQPSNKGLMATFKIGKGPLGEQALSDAEDKILDGFSIEIDFNDEVGDSWQPDPSDESIRLVRQASLMGTALTGNPAFDDARLTSVKASRNDMRGRADASEGQGADNGGRHGLQGRGVRVLVRGLYKQAR